MIISFPFNSAGGFGTDVVDHPVDSLHLIDDAVWEFSQEFVRQVSPVGGHTVGAGDGADGYNVFVGAGITHDPHGFYRKQDRERLP